MFFFHTPNRFPTAVGLTDGYFLCLKHETYRLSKYLQVAKGKEENGFHGQTKELCPDSSWKSKIFVTEVAENSPRGSGKEVHHPK